MNDRRRGLKGDHPIAGHRLEVTLCYWLAGLAPFVILILRRGQDKYRLTRFHALQALGLWAIGGVSLMIYGLLDATDAVWWLTVLFFGVGFLALLYLFILGLSSIGGAGLVLPVLGPAARKWSGWRKEPDMNNSTSGKPGSTDETT